MIPGALPQKEIARKELTATATSHTFSGIAALIAALPFTARHLIVTLNGRSDRVTTGQSIGVRINNDLGVNYNREKLQGAGANDTAERGTGETSIVQAFTIDGASNPAGASSGGSMLIPHAFNTYGHTAMLSLAGASEQVERAIAGRYADVATVESITVFTDSGHNLEIGTVLTLYAVDERYCVEEQILTVDGAFSSIGNLNDLIQKGDLQLVVYGRTDRVLGEDSIVMAVNGDAANSTRQILQGQQSTTNANTSNGQVIGDVTGGTATANAFGAVLASISAFSEGDNDPHWTSIAGFHDAVATRSKVGLISGRRNNIEAINALALTPIVGTNFIAGSGAWLYWTPKREIGRIELTALSAAETFASISQNYRGLRLSFYLRGDRATPTDFYSLEFNGDTIAANYDQQQLIGFGSTVSAGVSAARKWNASIPGGTATANIFGGGTILIPQYTKTDRHKHGLQIVGENQTPRVELLSDRWEDLSAITDIKVLNGSGNNFVAGCIIVLEGIGRIDTDIWAEIDGVEIQKRKDSLSIRKTIEARDVADLTVVDTPGTATYSKGQKVEVLQGTDVMFGGIIETVEKRKFGSDATIFHEIRAVGFARIADKRLAAASYVSQTAEFIIRDLAVTWLTPENIGLGNIEVGATIDEMVVNYAPMSKTLDALAERSGFIWNINELGYLSFQPRTTELNGTTVQPSIITKRTPKVKKHAPKYRNRQFIRAGRGVTSSQVEDFLGDANQFAFTVGYPINTVPVVKLATVTQTIGIKGLEVGKQVFWNKSDATVVFATAPGNGVAVEITYVGEFPILLVADEPTQIADRLAVEGGTGIWETIDDEPSITDVDAAKASAIAKLDRFAVIGDRLEFDTITSGFEPGQLATVSHALISTDMLIQSVEITEFGGRADTPTYRIVMLTGPTDGDWTQYFRALASQKSEVLDRLTVGRDELLIIVVREGGNWDWSDTITQTVFACPVPGPAQTPEPTLFPC